MTRPAPETWLLAAICLADLVSTILLIRAGVATEGNPLLRAALDRGGVVAFSAAKTAMTALPLAGLEAARRECGGFVQRAQRLGIAGYVAIYGIGFLVQGRF